MNKIFHTLFGTSIPLRASRFFSQASGWLAGRVAA